MLSLIESPNELKFEKIFSKILYQKCWEDKHRFLLINNNNEMDNIRYRKGFDQSIMIYGVIYI